MLETSGLRHVTFTGRRTGTSAVGKGLFDFGFVDGDSDTARMQHLGLARLARRLHRGRGHHHAASVAGTR